MATAIRKTNGRAVASIDRLLAFAVGQVVAAEEDCTFERLVYECFTLFPDAFAMQRYPQWPDSVRINKTWLRCRTDRGWIVGSVQEGFRLTEQGAHVASEVAHVLGKNPAAAETGPGNRARERYEAMLRHVRRQPSFQAYQADPGSFSLSDSGLRVLLNATLETPRRILRQNLRAYQNAAAAYQDAEAGAFLAACGEMLKEGVVT